jgi:hypothetical protein
VFVGIFVRLGGMAMWRLVVGIIMVLFCICSFGYALEKWLGVLVAVCVTLGLLLCCVGVGLIVSYF